MRRASPREVGRLLEAGGDAQQRVDLLGELAGQLTGRGTTAGGVLERGGRVLKRGRALRERPLERCRRERSAGLGGAVGRELAVEVLDQHRPIRRVGDRVGHQASFLSRIRGQAGNPGARQRSAGQLPGRANAWTGQTNRSPAVSHGAAIRSSAENHAGIAFRWRRSRGAPAGALARSLLADHRGGVLEQRRGPRAGSGRSAARGRTPRRDRTRARTGPGLTGFASGTLLGSVPARNSGKRSREGIGFGGRPVRAGRPFFVLIRGAGPRPRERQRARAHGPAEGSGGSGPRRTSDASGRLTGCRYAVMALQRDGATTSREVSASGSAGCRARGRSLVRARSVTRDRGG